MRPVRGPSCQQGSLREDTGGVGAVALAAEAVGGGVMAAMARGGGPGDGQRWRCFGDAHWLQAAHLQNEQADAVYAESVPALRLGVRRRRGALPYSAPAEASRALLAAAMRGYDGATSTHHPADHCEQLVIAISPQMRIRSRGGMRAHRAALLLLLALFPVAQCRLSFPARPRVAEPAPTRTRERERGVIRLGKPREQLGRLRQLLAGLLADRRKRRVLVAVVVFNWLQTQARLHFGKRRALRAFS